MKIPKINTPDGLFHDGDHVAGVEGTIVTAAWLNAVQKAFKDIGLEKVSKSGDSMTGMLKAPGFNFANEMIVSGYNSATASGDDWTTSGNIDGLWYDDLTNTFHFQSDAVYKSTGNAKIQTGGLLIGDENADDRYLLTVNRSNSTNNASKVNVATSYAVKAAKDAADAVHVDYVDDLNNVSDVGFCAFKFNEKSLGNNLADAAPALASSTYDAVGFQIKKAGQTTQFLSTGGYHFIRFNDVGSDWEVHEILTHKKITNSVNATSTLTVPSSKALNDVYKKLQAAQKLALVGVPIPYPKATPPAGYAVMKGQTINKSKYPKLAKIYGERLPDLRGDVIRGWDNGRGVDNGRELLSHQDDAIRNITGNIGKVVGGAGDFDFSSGAFYRERTEAAFMKKGENDKWAKRVAFDASRVVPTASENRMKNTAFNYICLLG